MACTLDTPTVDLTVDEATGVLSADVKISADTGNIVEAHTDGLFVGSSAVLIPAGAVIPYAGAAAPAGWLLCQGQEVSRSVYSTLFGIIGTTYGVGDSSNTFNVPDLRGRVAVGLSPAGHVDVDALNDNEGIAAADFAFRRPRHRHTPHTHGLHIHSVDSSGGCEVPADGGTGGSNDTISACAVNATDGGSGNVNDPVDGPAFLTLNYIVKT